MSKKEWNVYYYDINRKEIKTYNIMNHLEPFIKDLKKKKLSKEEFEKELNSELMYHYWSKAEWEILIRAWVGGSGKEEIKIDVYSQIKMNWNHFVNYCWNEV